MLPLEDHGECEDFNGEKKKKNNEKLTVCFLSIF